MARVQLTDRFCQAAKPEAGRPGEQTDYFDAVTHGLALRCSAGRKIWSFFFTSPASGNRSRVALGSYPAE